MPKDIAVALKYRDEEGTSSKFSEPPDIILPSQYFGVVERRGYLTPEKKGTYDLVKSQHRVPQEVKEFLGFVGEPL